MVSCQNRVVLLFFHKFNVCQEAVLFFVIFWSARYSRMDTVLLNFCQMINSGCFRSQAPPPLPSKGNQPRYRTPHPFLLPLPLSLPFRMFLPAAAAISNPDGSSHDSCSCSQLLPSCCGCHGLRLLFLLLHHHH